MEHIGVYEAWQQTPVALGKNKHIKIQNFEYNSRDIDYEQILSDADNVGVDMWWLW